MSKSGFMSAVVTENMSFEWTLIARIGHKVSLGRREMGKGYCDLIPVQIFHFDVFEHQGPTNAQCIISAKYTESFW